MHPTVARRLSTLVILLGLIALVMTLAVVAKSLQRPNYAGGQVLAESPAESIPSGYLRWWYSGVFARAAQYLLLIGAGFALRKDRWWALPTVVTLLIILALDSVRVLIIGPGYLEVGVALLVLGALGYAWWGIKK